MSRPDSPRISPVLLYKPLQSRVGDAEFASRNKPANSPTMDGSISSGMMSQMLRASLARYFLEQKEILGSPFFKGESIIIDEILTISFRALFALR